MSESSATSDRADVAARLADLLGRRVPWQSRQWLQTRSGVELTNQQRLTLAILWDGPRTFRDVARHLGVSAPIVTGIADRLGAQGFVERIPHPTSRRQLLLRITPAGEAALDQAETAIDSYIEGLLTDLSTDKLAQLRTGLVVLEEVVSQIAADGDVSGEDEPRLPAPTARPSGMA